MVEFSFPEDPRGILLSECRAVAIPVNTVGVMGAGLARAAAEKYPGLLGEFRKLCREGKLRPGQPALVKGGWKHWIYLFPTKRDWRDPSRIEWIREGIDALLGQMAGLGVDSLALPALGCGLGKLPWGAVLPEILRLRELPDDFECRVEVYPPEERIAR